MSKEVVEKVNRVYPITDFRHHMKTLEVGLGREFEWNIIDKTLHNKS